MNRLFPVITPAQRCLALLFLLIALSISSCRRLDERMEIKETRAISTYASSPAPVVPTSERFVNADIPESDTPKAPPPQNIFIWTTPEGWREAGEDPSGMRFINLQFGPQGEGECYLSLMPGKAGGLEANVNRWRTQMGQPPYTPEELEKLPKKPLLNRDATYVSFSGDFKGVGAAAAAKDYQLVGLVLPAPEFTLFVKMTGPKALVDQNMPAFEQFIQSVTPAR